MIHTELTQIPC